MDAYQPDMNVVYVSRILGSGLKAFDYKTVLIGVL